MGFFDDDEEEGRDPFEEIMNEFFGNRSRVRKMMLFILFLNFQDFQKMM